MAVIELPRSEKNPQHIISVFPSPLNDMRSWDYSANAISPYVAWSDCINDYPTRHTPYGVMPSDRLEEFLFLLASYMKANGANPVIADMWPRQPEPAKLLRFHELKHGGSNPPPLFNANSGETSKAAKYRNNRDWREVPPWATGHNTAAQVYQLYPHGWHNSLYQLVWYRQAWRTLPFGTCEDTPIPDTLKKRAQGIWRLLDACQSYVDAFKAKASGDNDLDCYESVWKNVDEQ